MEVIAYKRHRETKVKTQQEHRSSVEFYAIYSQESDTISVGRDKEAGQADIVK
jgi:hypothetical protein